MYYRLLDEYLTHYQPERRQALLVEGTLQPWLDEMVAAMEASRTRILAQLREKYPEMSEQQCSIEAEQTVREMYLTLA